MDMGMYMLVKTHHNVKVKYMLFIVHVNCNLKSGLKEKILYTDQIKYIFE